MKTNRLFLFLVMMFITLSATAQNNAFDDDIYHSPKDNKAVQVTTTVKTVAEMPRQIAVTAIVNDERDVDEYNRRYSDSGEYYDEPVVTAANDTVYEYVDGDLTKRIVRFHNPEKVIVSGADNMNVEYNGEDYELSFNEPDNSSVNISVYNYGGGGYYDPFYWGYGWHRPYYYSGWYSPWYSPWYYHGWYSPWYNGYYGGGYYGGWYGYCYNHYYPYYTSSHHYSANGRRGSYVGSNSRGVNSRVSGNGGRSSSVSREGNYATSRSSSVRTSRDNAASVSRGSASRGNVTSSTRGSSDRTSGVSTSRSASRNNSSGNVSSQSSGSSRSSNNYSGSSSSSSNGSGSSRSSSSYGGSTSRGSSGGFSGGGSSHSSGGGGRSSGGGGRR
ncbi:MAG: hypothetical protein LBS54_01510 [Dysgonamonadaceae bacterium]|jgi:hypothetical protein|nr:hypothetical protein [Dysgonamonadaceae bacterium]